ncbi:MAG TPA: S41 family peptidase [Pyrinomonadaceae bacterium]|nr:S41 family peptidase [Pyrinomonadaceae bacterium]
MRPTLSSVLSHMNRNARLKHRNAHAAHRMHIARRAAANLLLPALFFVIALASFNAAQQPRMPEQADMTIDAATRAEVIEGTLKNLREGYVYPEVATRMEQAIRERVAKREYEDVTSAKQLAQMLTEHLQAVSRDKHLRVNYRAAVLSEGDIPGARIVRRRVPDDGGGGSSPSSDEAGLRRVVREPGSDATQTPTADGETVVRRVRPAAGGEAGVNLGLEKIETLEGNLGYLDFSMFDGSDEAQAKVSEAMNRLADTDALIIDLRRCRGGASNTITLLMSYFFDKSIHLSSAYDRIADSTRESWSLDKVPGRRYGQKDVYILTSSFTFSAAEDISYTLKNLKRATIVGETTGGGAHPVRGRRLNDHFFVMIPFARYISPVTKTNWEGTGVEPDVKVNAPHALKVAQLTALKKLSVAKRDAKDAAQLKSLIETLQKEVDVLKKENSKS